MKKGKVVFLVILLIGALVGAGFGIKYFLFPAVDNSIEITVEAEDGGEVISDTGELKFTPGKNVVFTITPDEGYYIESIEVDDEAVDVTVDPGEEQEYTFENITQAHTIQVVFGVVYSVTISYDSEQGAISSDSGRTKFILGEDSVFTITPDEGYYIESIEVDDETVDVTVDPGEEQEYIFENITQAHTIQVVFGVRTYDIVVSDVENGSISPVPQEDGIQTYTITPDANYKITGVTVDGNAVDLGEIGQGDSFSIDVSIEGEHTISATFSLKTFTVTFKDHNNSTLQESTDVEYGSAVVAPADPDNKTGYHFLQWSSNNYQNVHSDVIITAQYTINVYTITSTQVDKATITATKEANYGTNSTFTIIPTLNYYVRAIIIDGIEISINNYGENYSYTFENVAADHTFSAVIGYQGPWTYEVNAGNVTITGYTGIKSAQTISGGITTITTPSGIITFGKDTNENTILGISSGMNLYLPNRCLATNEIWTYKIGGVGTTYNSYSNYSLPSQMATYSIGSYSEGAIMNVSAGWTYTRISGVTYLTGVPAGTGTLIVPAVIHPAIGNYNVNCIGNGTVPVSNLSGYTNIYIETGITTISAYAFKESSAVNVVIPKTVKTIGTDAFRSCTALAKVLMGERITEIGISAFRNCTSLTSIEMLYGVNTIKEYAFSGCSSLSSIRMTDSVSRIERYAFRSTPITSFTFNSKITEISQGLFSGCEDLETIIIPNTITKIGSSAFSGCIALTSVTIGTGVTEIGGEVFRDCSSLTSLVIPNSVTSIGTGVIWDCSELTSITIGNGITSLPALFFKDCNSLEIINIGSGVATIGASILGAPAEDSVFTSGLTQLINVNVNSSNSVYMSVSGIIYKRDGTWSFTPPHNTAG